MHEFFVNIGYAILNFFRNVKTDNILKSLSIMGIGMVGIFFGYGYYRACGISPEQNKQQRRKNKKIRKKNNKPALRFAPQGGFFVIYFAT